MGNKKILLENFLKENALWLIMDPWFPTPYVEDYEIFPGIDEYNEKVIQKIVNYIPHLKHVCVSCPKSEFDAVLNKEIKISVHPKLKHLPNTKNKFSNLIKIMENKNISNIVYCGFHYGECILFKDDGVESASKIYKTYVKKNLCGLFPNTYTWKEADKITKKYAKII